MRQIQSVGGHLVTKRCEHVTCQPGFAEAIYCKLAVASERKENESQVLHGQDAVPPNHVR